MSMMRNIISASLELSEQQLKSATEADWESFHEHEPKRQQLIKSLENVDVDVNAPDEIRSNLENLISLNNRIEKLCVEQRNDLMKMLVDLRAGAKANNAYGK